MGDAQLTAPAREGVIVITCEAEPARQLPGSSFLAPGSWAGTSGAGWNTPGQALPFFCPRALLPGVGGKGGRMSSVVLERGAVKGVGFKVTLWQPCLLAGPYPSMECREEGVPPISTVEVLLPSLA